MFLFGVILVVAGGILAYGNTKGILPTFPFAGLSVGTLGGLLMTIGEVYRVTGNREFFDTAGARGVERALLRRLAGVRMLRALTVVFILVGLAITPATWLVARTLGAKLLALLVTVMACGRGWLWWGDLGARREALAGQLMAVRAAASREA
jgi:hypothetical protein